MSVSKYKQEVKKPAGAYRSNSGDLVALENIPTANVSASRQYAGLRQNALGVPWRQEYAPASKYGDGTLGFSNVLAVPESLPAASKQNVKADLSKYDTDTGSSGRGGSGGTYTVNANNQPYVDQLNSLYDQIVNRKPFQYDLNGDLLYRQMADQYTQLGQQAMRDTMGQAAALTGGYGNSYAQQVGNQSYQQYLTALNEQIPALYDRAFNVWQAEGNDLLNRYQMAAAHPGYLDAISPKTYSVASSDDENTDGGMSLTDYLNLLRLTGYTGATPVASEMPFYNWPYRRDDKKK